MASKILSPSHLCVPFLDNKCTMERCINYHPTTPEQIKVAKAEVKIKYTDAFKMNKICINFNDEATGCKHNPCKFLHVKVDRNPRLQKPQYVSKPDSLNSKLMSAIDNLNGKIAKLEALQVSSAAYKVPAEIYKLRDYYYTQLERLADALLFDTGKIPDI